MNKSLRWFLVLSMAIHIWVAIFFLRAPEQRISASQPVTITYQDNGPVKTKISGKNPKTNTASLKNLLPKYSYRQNDSALRKRSASFDLNATALKGGGNNSEEIAAFSSPIQSLQDAVELDPFYQALWSRIAAVAEYPEDFSKHYIQGSVSIRMEVTFQGVMTKRRLVVESTNPYLETLAIYTVIRALKDPLPSKFWATQSKLPATIHLNYIHRMPDDPRALSPGSIVGHHLEISKYDYVPPELMKKLDDFMLTYFPPVVPIPGGFYIDFVRAYEMIKRAQEPDQNEMRSYRVEALQDSLERLITEAQRSNDS